MPRRRLHLELSELGDLHSRVLVEFGPDAEVIAAEKVTVGGIAGFLSRQHYEVTVEVPSSILPPSQQDAHELDVPARVGLAALLAEADETEARISAPASRSLAPAVSTASAQFDDLMTSLSVTSPRPAPRTPALRTNPGDLVLLVGVWRDPVRVARAIAGAAEAAVCAAGTVIAPGAERIDNRRDALEARARGVRDGHGVVVALGLAPGRADQTAELVTAIAPDQVWVVVDASRKVEDTSAWVDRIGAVIPIDAMAVLGRDDTATPESVDALGLPVGWVDGAPVSASPRPAPPHSPRASPAPAPRLTASLR